MSKGYNLSLVLRRLAPAACHERWKQCLDAPLFVPKGIFDPMSLRRALALGALAAVATTAFAEGLPKRILLVPIDDRPATTQFAQMIADMAGVSVELPPDAFLGKFLQPGWPESILQWMESKGIAQYDAVVLSTDMVAYGGLIASRTDRSSYILAINRLRELWRIRKTAPNTRFYAFSAVMRLAPTATSETERWMLDMARYAVESEKYRTLRTSSRAQTLRNLRARIPKGEIGRYDAVRERDHRVQQELVRMAHYGVFDYLILGQDDAQAEGPHVRETERLLEMAKNLQIVDRVFFAEGIDQHSNVLVSRAMLDRAGWSPRVRIVFADDAAKTQVAAYESESIEGSLRDQLLVSGASPVGPDESFDYSLYVNTPDSNTMRLKVFLDSLKSEVDQGFPVAVADINLGKSGTGDPALFDVVTEHGRATRLLAYAGWNTAGNTMGTAIPAANVYLLARKEQVDPLVREVGLRKFVLHRLVNDFEYHSFVRPEAYRMISQMPNSSKAEAYGTDYEALNQYVSADMKKRLLEQFSRQLLGTRFYEGAQQVEIVGLKDVKVYLPWPRAYEVRLDFEIETRPVGPELPKITVLPLGGGGGRKP